VGTTDLEDLSWSPDGRAIAVWDHLLEMKVCHTWATRMNTLLGDDLCS
jgi:hypothetical protein